MNLKTAEEWDKQMDEWNERYHVRLSIIRQIQADALRWAAQRCKEHRHLDSQYSAGLLEDKANELDPLPKKANE